MGKGLRATEQALLLTAASVLLSGCMGFAALDQAPVAQFTVTNLSGETELRVGEGVVLDASASEDPQGYALTYEWELKSAQASPVRLSSTSGKTVSFYPDDENSAFFVSLKVTARAQSDVTELRPILVNVLRPGKVRLTIETDGNGDVKPWGVRALWPETDVIVLEAAPKKGFQFLKWVVSGSGVANIVDQGSALTSASVSSGPVIIQAQFEALAAPPHFVGWKKAYPNGLAEVDGQTGTVTGVGEGFFSGLMDSLARSADGVLYAAGSPFAPNVGDQLFVIDPVTRLAGVGVGFTDEGAATTVASLAFTSAGTLYGLGKVSPSRLYTVDTSTAVLSSGVDLSLDSQPVRLESITFSAEANGFLGTDGAHLFKVDFSGLVTKIGDFGTLATLTSLTLGKDGRLFALSKEAAQPSIYTIDPATGTASPLVGLSAELLSFLIEP